MGMILIVMAIAFITMVMCLVHAIRIPVITMIMFFLGEQGS